ncbi:hypothetical protein MNBD_GAMMA10-2806 [hydrothermal vent metagenome]|uniref:DUF3144 domain-containing protein n=1 Tax=hydrothermal vent metagenome TaxID=652676 RepID=A0A3B0YAU1_9ZZZZ
MQDADDNFYKRADEHIHLSNSQITEAQGKGEVSASFMYSVARYNAYVSACGYSNVDEFMKDKEVIVNYFSDQYKKMLEENLEDYMLNFSKYMTTEDIKS